MEQDRVASQIRDLIKTSPDLAGKREVTFPYETAAFNCAKASTLPSGQMAYEMVSHKIKSPDGQERDVTGRYATGPTIPGPTLVMKEGETAEVTLEHGIADSPQPVSIHVHGVHYKIDSDGTTKMMNGVADEAAFPGKPYTYKWTAAPGTAGISSA